MKSPVLLAGVLALAALVAPASASPSQNCVHCTVDGPTVCNCTDDATSITLCTSSEVQVSSGGSANITGTWPGLSASGEINFSKTVTTGESRCAYPTLAPNTCEWWMYRFQVCVEYVLHESVFGDKLVPETTVTFLGLSLTSGPAGPDDC
jgi:hypothetical protein